MQISRASRLGPERARYNPEMSESLRYEEAKSLNLRSPHRCDVAQNRLLKSPITKESRTAHSALQRCLPFLPVGRKTSAEASVVIAELFAAAGKDRREGSEISRRRSSGTGPVGVCVRPPVAHASNIGPRSLERPLPKASPRRWR